MFYRLPTCLLVLCTATIANAQELSGLAAEAFAAEQALWQSESDGDVAAFAARLDDDFVQITTSTGTDVSIINGRENATASLEMALQSMSFGEFELELANTRVIGNAVVLTFRFQQEYLSKTDSTPLRVQGVATSIWTKHPEDGWLNVHFHWHSQASP